MDKQRHAGQTTRRKRNQPHDNRSGSCGLFFYSKDRRVRKERRHLRPATRSRQMHGRSYESERHHQHSVAQTEACQRADKTMRNPKVDEQNEEPVSRGIKHGECEIAPSSDGLHAAREAEKDSGNLGAPAVRAHPTLQAALEQRGSVQPQIYQEYDRADYAGEKNGRPCKMKQRLEREKSERVAKGKPCLARERGGRDGFTGAHKEKARREARQRHCVNRSETRWTQVLLKHFPAERTQRVTRIDGKAGKNQKKWVRMADSTKQLGPAEISKVNHPA